MQRQADACHRTRMLHDKEPQLLALRLIYAPSFTVDATASVGERFSTRVAVAWLCASSVLASASTLASMCGHRVSEHCCGTVAALVQRPPATAARLACRRAHRCTSASLPPSSCCPSSRCRASPQLQRFRVRIAPFALHSACSPQQRATAGCRASANHGSCFLSVASMPCASTGPRRVPVYQEAQ